MRRWHAAACSGSRARPTRCRTATCSPSASTSSSAATAVAVAALARAAIAIARVHGYLLSLSAKVADTLMNIGIIYLTQGRSVLRLPLSGLLISFLGFLLRPGYDPLWEQFPDRFLGR